MPIKLNKVTWYSRMLSYLFVFGVFPIIVFYIGIKYTQTVEVLTYADASAAELYSSGTYDNKSFQGAGSFEARENIEGDWASDENPERTMTIRSNNTFFEKDGDEVVRSGSWMIQDRLRDTKYSNLPIDLYLQKNSLAKGGKEEILYYKIMQLDATTLQLVYLEKGNSQTYTKTGDSKVHSL